MEKLVQGEDFYYNAEGYVVLTEAYHIKKGNCCGNGCLHCPYLYANVPQPLQADLVKKQAHANKSKKID